MLPRQSTESTDHAVLVSYPLPLTVTRWQQLHLLALCDTLNVPDCQECTVADDVPSRAEDYTFPVVL